MAPVKLLYPSFRAFLVVNKNRNGNPVWVDERETREWLADRCLGLLLSVDILKKDMCSLLPGTLRSEIIQKTIGAALPPEVQYVCRFWVYYYWKEGARRVRDGDLVNRFLANHLLHCLEALGIMGRIREGYLVLGGRGPASLARRLLDSLSNFLYCFHSFALMRLVGGEEVLYLRRCCW